MHNELSPNPVLDPLSGIPRSNPAAANLASAGERVVLARPAGVEPWEYILGLSAVLWIGLVLGLQLTIAGFTVFGAKTITPELSSHFTDYGRELIRPERDLPIYVAGMLGTFVLSMGILLLWQRKLDRLPPARAREFVKFSSAMLGLVGTVSATLFSAVLILFYPRDRVDKTAMDQAPHSLHGLILFAPAVLTIVLILVESLAARLAASDSHQARVERIRGASRWFLDVSIPVMIVLVTLILPARWTEIAGFDFGADNLHHWNFYAAGPVLAYHHGASICRDVYSQYGMGWPLLFAHVPGGVTFSMMIGVGVVYSCIYFVSLYLFLSRGLFANSTLAAIVVIASVTLELLGLDKQLIWRYPSSSVMRHAMDIWFFMVLLAHARSNKIAWLLLAGVLCGAGLVFGTDTGWYLFATFLWYAALSFVLNGILSKRPWLSRTAIAIAVFVLTSGGTLYLGAWLACHHRQPDTAFWLRWIESLNAYAAFGVSMIPVASVPRYAMFAFAFVLLVYVLTMLAAVVHLLAGGRRPEIIVLSSVAVYGLGLLLVFVGRSHQRNLFHPIIPFLICAVGLIWLAGRKMAGWWRVSTFPAIVLALFLVGMIVSPGSRAYPGLLQTRFAAASKGGMFLCGHDVRIPLDDASLPRALAVKQIALAITKLPADDRDVVVFDELDTSIYWFADRKPWSRYTSEFHALLLTSERQKTIDQLKISRPIYVIIREPNTLPFMTNFIDSWKMIRQAVESNYDRVDTVGGFGIWRLRTDAGSGK